MNVIHFSLQNHTHMLNRLIISILLLTATAAMSFQTPENQVSTSISPKSGNSLTVTNPSPGTAVMAWSFAQPSLSYEYIIEDVVHRQVVKSGQTSQSGYTATGLATGTYRFRVSNGTEYIVIEDLVML